MSPINYYYEIYCKITSKWNLLSVFFSGVLIAQEKLLLNGSVNTCIYMYLAVSNELNKQQMAVMDEN
jgi:hypothetical protein